MKSIAVILAGGSGNRLNASFPKQFIKIAGKTVLEHTITPFQNHPDIDEIAVVSNPDYIRDVEELVIRNRFTKVKKILSGGKERYSSSLSAIDAYRGDDDLNLIFHDAVRPLIDDRIISDVIVSLKSEVAVDVVVPATDTIVEVVDGYIKTIPNRSLLHKGQTPQAFRLSVIDEAYRVALSDSNFVTTDDCGVVRKYLPDVPVRTIAGAEYNMKLTYQEDVFILDKLFQLRSRSIGSEAREGLSNLKDRVICIFGGSYGIGKEIVELATREGAKVYPFSRSTTNTDIANPKDVREALEKVYKSEGRIDFVVNAAAILQKQPLEHMSDDDITYGIDVNLKGAMFVAKESLRFLKETKGALLFYTSSSYTYGRMYYALYSATKSAIVNLTQALSQEWYQDSVRVNCINPERTKTPMRTSNFGCEPDNTLLLPETVAEKSLVTLLASFSGQVIDVKLEN